MRDAIVGRGWKCLLARKNRMTGPLSRNEANGVHYEEGDGSTAICLPIRPNFDSPRMFTHIDFTPYSVCTKYNLVTV